MLTITLFDGGQLTGKVTGATEVKCENEHSAEVSGHGDDEPGDDHGDDGPGHDRGGRRDRSCPAGALKAGAAVHEADLKVTSAGRIWDEIELR